MATPPDTASPPESRRLRPVLFVGLSALIHLAGVLALAVLAWEPWVPRVEITWLDLDNRLGAPTPRPKVAPPPPVKVAPPPPKQRPGPSPKKVAVARPRPDAGPPPDAGAPADAGSSQGPQLADLAPGDAALILVLRMDRIRRSPYALSVRRLLEVFYDYKTLLWSRDLDPIEDFDALLIATPNPYRVTRTFLAARHHLSRSRIRRALEQSVALDKKRMRWRWQGRVQRGEIPSPPRLPQDPRMVLLQDGLVMLADPAHIPLLTTDLGATTPRPAGERADAGARTGRSWLDSLGQMQGVGGADDAKAPGMQLLAVNLPRLVRLPPDVPVPLNVDVQVPAEDPTLAAGEVTFGAEADARRFLQVIPQRIARARRSMLLRLLGVTDLLDGIKLRRKGERVEVSLKLTGDQVRSLLELFRGMIPQVRVPGMAPRVPPDAGRPDTGRYNGPDSAAPDAGPSSER